jgi:hypothetical protein
MLIIFSGHSGADYLEMNDMKNTLVKFATLVAFAASGPVFAQDVDADLAKGACKKDVKLSCSGIQPGGGQIQACLTANADKLTDNCKAAVAKTTPAAAPPADTMQTPAAEPQAAPPK